MKRALYRANYGYLLRHPWQLALAVLGISIGVAVIVAVDLANSSSKKAFLLSMDAVTGKATHQIIGGLSDIDEDLYVELRVQHGIRSIAPIVEGYVTINERSLQVLGVDLFAEQEMRAFSSQLTPEDASDATQAQSVFREMLTRPGAVMMSQPTADALGLTTGDHFEVLAGGKIRPAILSGTYKSATETGLGSLFTTDIATAQAWFDKANRLSRIDVRITDEDAGLEDRLEKLLPGDTTLLATATRTRTTTEMSAAFMTNLAAMSLLALLVGLFLIYNSVSFSVLQRRRLIGILRALGTTRRQVITLVLTETAGIGLIAATLGVMAGIWLGGELLGLVSQSINDFYFRVTVTDVSISTSSVTKGVVAGIGAALVAAVVPAIEASSYRPRLSLTRSALEQQTRRLLPFVALAGVVTIALAMVVLAFSGRGLVAGLISVFMLILGFALCVPLVVKAAAHFLSPIAKRLGGVWARLAVADIGSSLSRTGVAIVALAVAVSATIGVSVMVDSFRGSVSDWLEQTLQADIYAGIRRGTLDPVLLKELSQISGVVAFSSNRRSWHEDENGRTQVLATKMAPGSYAGTEILDANPKEVWSLFERDDVVLVSEPYAYRNRVTPGDSVALRTASGKTEFRIIATYQSYDINAAALLMSRQTYDRHFDDSGVDSIGLYLDDGVDVADVIAQMEAISRGRQELLINSNVKIRELSLQIFDRTFVITDVLYWLAVGVAFIGILGAMLALQLERARDFAVLRALGMTQLQLGGMITLQTSIIGLLSGLAAIPLGLVMAYVLIEVINRRAFGWQIDMAIAPDILLSAVLFAVVAALLAGIYPAWRTAQSQPALAMREE
ncbi:MAG: FtsX-like permease family protein [Woeseiaceae bacterium]